MSIAEYKRLLTQAYDLDKPEAPAEELAHYRRHTPGGDAPVLEAMCGSGRFLLALLADGVAIEGCDASAPMLEACRQRARERGLAEPTLHHQLLQDLAIPRRFDLVFCGGGSFGLIADIGDVQRALTALREHLLPGGRLLLEVETPAAAARTGVWTGRSWTRADGATITLRMITAFDRDTAIETGVGIYELFTNDGPPEVEINNWIRKLWTPDGIEAVLRQAGFELVQLTRAFSNEPYDTSSDMISVLAMR